MTAALLVSLLLLALNAFFVAAEFALVASKRHRLEDLAERGSAAARAAVRGSRELSLMLAGAQLGITLCTLGLGSLAKPAVAELLTPVFTFARVPDAAAYVVSVVLAVGIVVFLHMVVGEMAPKSWAIAHPERSAVLLALPFRAFTRVMLPALRLLNALANGCLRIVGVTPQDELGQVHGPKELQLLLASSKDHGMLAEPEHRVLAGAIDLDTIPVADLVVPSAQVVGVLTTATCAQAEAVSRETGRSRLVVREGEIPVGVAHVRDVVRAHPGAPVATVTTPALHVDAGLSLLDALSLMRLRHAQLVLVDGPSGPLGLVTMEDLLEQVLGRFDDETDA
ncbi:hemolysin family protein [Terrabacter sp. BE26]|uniref:hemolysin family protein n=1 Tax=Terrabacter sp. BE26 TaxID=2898152 RepID=UPI0035BE17F5